MGSTGLQGSSDPVYRIPGPSGKIELAQGEGGFGLCELATVLEGGCNRRVIQFGSCATLEFHGNTLNRILHRTGALALFSYKSDVDWLSSCAFDLLLLDALQEVPFTAHGMWKLDSLLNETALGLRRKLAFRIKYDRARPKANRRGDVLKWCGDTQGGRAFHEVFPRQVFGLTPIMVWRWPE